MIPTNKATPDRILSSCRINLTELGTAKLDNISTDFKGICDTRIS